MMAQNAHTPLTSEWSRNPMIIDYKPMRSTKRTIYAIGDGMDNLEYIVVKPGDQQCSFIKGYDMVRRVEIPLSSAFTFRGDRSGGESRKISGGFAVMSVDGYTLYYNGVARLRFDKPVRHAVFPVCAGIWEVTPSQQAENVSAL